MLSGGPHHLIKDKFVVVKMPLNVHIQDEVKLDRRTALHIFFTILTREIIRLILQRP